MSAIIPTPAEWRDAMRGNEEAMNIAILIRDTAAQAELRLAHDLIQTWNPGGTQ